MGKVHWQENHHVVAWCRQTRDPSRITRDTQKVTCLNCAAAPSYLAATRKAGVMHWLRSTSTWTRSQCGMSTDKQALTSDIDLVTCLRCRGSVMFRDAEYKAAKPEPAATDSSAVAAGSLIILRPDGTMEFSRLEDAIAFRERFSAKPVAVAPVVTAEPPKAAAPQATGKSGRVTREIADAIFRQLSRDKTPIPFLYAIYERRFVSRRMLTEETFGGNQSASSVAAYQVGCVAVKTNLDLFRKKRESKFLWYVAGEDLNALIEEWTRPISEREAA